MMLIYTLLCALPLGLLIRDRGTAVGTYLGAGAFVFTFQSVGLVLDYLAHRNHPAFGPFPDELPIDYSDSDYAGYGLVNLLIVVAGVGLVVLGGRVRRRRDRRRQVEVVSDSTTTTEAAPS
jgi:hypothetical protein